MPESQLVGDFRANSAKALSLVKNIEQFRESDPMVDLVFKIGRELFETPLDQQNEGGLLRTGGKLTGALAYIGQKACYARAERDVYEQKREEMMSDMMLKYLDTDYKVTKARAEVKTLLREIDDLIVAKEAEKNQWENIMHAADKMTSFIQSSLKMKDTERFHSSRLQGQ